MFLTGTIKSYHGFVWSQHDFNIKEVKEDFSQLSVNLKPVY